MPSAETWRRLRDSLAQVVLEAGIRWIVHSLVAIATFLSSYWIAHKVGIMAGLVG